MMIHHFLCIVMPGDLWNLQCYTVLVKSTLYRAHTTNSCMLASLKRAPKQNPRSTTLKGSKKYIIVA